MSVFCNGGHTWCYDYEAVLGSITEFDEKDMATTIPWLDQFKPVVERMGYDLVEVGISKLKVLAIGDINTIRKEEGSTWHKFRQILIENYSNIPYLSGAVVAYANLTQWTCTPGIGLFVKRHMQGHYNSKN